jgi:hypothetical protein
MDKYKKEILRKILYAAKPDEFFTSNNAGFISISNLRQKDILPDNTDKRNELLRYFYEKEYLQFESKNGPSSTDSGGNLLRITAKGIDAIDPWWIRYEEVIVGAVIGGIFGIAGTILGFLLGFLKN